MTGISTSCYFPLYTEKSLLKLAQSGIKTVEIFLNAQAETEGEVLEELLRIKEEYGITVNSVHTYFAFAEKHFVYSPYERKLEDGRKLFKGIFEAAEKLGSKIVVSHGDYEPLRISDDEYIRRFSLIANEAAEKGIIFSQENVVNYRSSSVDFLKYFRESQKELFRMTLDVKQAVRSGVDPLYLAKEFSESVVNVHISDHGEKGDCLAPLQGDFDFESLFKILENGGYRGNYIIELYRSGFSGDEELLESYKNITKIYKKCCKK